MKDNCMRLHVAAISTFPAGERSVLELPTIHVTLHFKYTIFASQESQSWLHSIPQPQKHSAPFSPPRRTKSLLSLDHSYPIESVISCDVRPDRKGRKSRI